MPQLESAGGRESSRLLMWSNTATQQHNTTTPQHQKNTQTHRRGDEARSKEQIFTSIHIQKPSKESQPQASGVKIVNSPAACSRWSDYRKVIGPSACPTHLSSAHFAFVSSQADNLSQQAHRARHSCSFLVASPHLKSIRIVLASSPRILRSQTPALLQSTHSPLAVFKRAKVCQQLRVQLSAHQHIDLLASTASLITAIHSLINRRRLD